MPKKLLALEVLCHVHKNVEVTDTATNCMNTVIALAVAVGFEQPLLDCRRVQYMNGRASCR